MKEQKTIYYKDEINDEFSIPKIEARVIDENYKYNHNILWDFCSCILQNFISMPIKLLYQKIRFKLKYVGKENLKKCKDQGYFIYANHTQPFADTFIPSVADYPKRNFLIVNPVNISLKGTGTLVEMLGAIPIPNNKDGMKNFLDEIKRKIEKKYSITIYHGICKYPVRHPEVLGSLFQIGLHTNTIGDIVVEDNEFYFTNLTRLNSFVEDNLVNIGKQKVTLNKIDIISLTKERYQKITIVVNSMRLDTVISRLANISRNGALEKLKNKEIFVNFQEVMKPTYLLKEQDILSIRRVGKFKIGKILQETRKNKILLEIKKYN